MIARLGGTPISIGLSDTYQGEAQSRRVGATLDRFEQSVRAKLEASKDHKVVTLTPEQRAAWTARVSPIIEAWAGTDDAHAKVLAKVRELAADVKAAK